MLMQFGENYVRVLKIPTDT